MIDHLPDELNWLAEISPELRRELKSAASLVSLAAGTTICGEGSRCEHLPILVEGQARVFKASESGREMTLYRIYPGESCVLTASCIMSEVDFPAMAITERASRAIVVPARRVTGWFDEFPEWRHFVFDLVSRRMASMLAVVEEVAFQRMDQRLERYLDSAAAHGEVRATHQEIADELGTAREVVTRLLRELEARGRVKLHRGYISLV